MIHAEATTYYSLGATLPAPPRGRDGYRIELKTTRPGVSIRLRRNVQPRAPGDQTLEVADAAALFGGTGGELPVRLKLGASSRTHGLAKRREIAFEVRMPIASLEFERLEGLRAADVELVFVAVDEKGAASEPRVFAAPLRIPDGDWERARAASWPYEGTLVSRPGEHRYTVTVRDVRSNRIGSAEARGSED